MVIPIICFSFIPEFVRADEKRQIASRIGISSHIIYEDFVLYDLFIAYPLAGQNLDSSRTCLSWQLHATAGMLSAAGKNALLVAIGPALTWKKSGGRIALTGGFNFAYVSRYEFGNAHIGGPVQFFSHFAVECLITQDFGVGYHFQHLSNADIYYHNPGMNLHSISISYYF